MNRRRKAKNEPNAGSSNDAPGPVRDFQWLCKRYGASVTVILLVCWFFGRDILSGSLTLVQRAWTHFHPPIVTVAVLDFNQQSSSLSIRFSNNESRPIIVQEAYLEILPHVGTTLNPIPRPLSDSISAFNKGVVQIPPGGGIKVDEGNYSLLAYFIDANNPLTIPSTVNASIFVTNVPTMQNAFRSIQEQYSHGSFTLSLHLNFIDAENISHESTLGIGDYQFDARGNWLKGKAFPLSTQLLPSPPSDVAEVIQGTFLVSHSRTQVGDPRDWSTPRIAIYRNTGTIPLLFCAEDMSGVPEEVPLLFIDQSVEFIVGVRGFPSSSPQQPTEARYADWCLSPDGGTTLLAVVDLISNVWSDTNLSKDVGVDHVVGLTNSAWSIREGADTWAPLDRAFVHYRVKRGGWYRMFPRQELAFGTMADALAEVQQHRTTVSNGWRYIDDVSDFQRQYETVLVCESGFAPAFNLASNKNLSDILTQTDAQRQTSGLPTEAINWLLKP